MKISNFEATRCKILRLKCAKFYFCWGDPQTSLEELTALPQTLQLYLRSLLVREVGATRKGMGMGEEKEGEGKGFAGAMSNCFPHACCVSSD